MISLATHSSSPVVEPKVKGPLFASDVDRNGARYLPARTHCQYAFQMEVGVNLTKIWNSTLGTMQVQISRHEFNTWLRRATLISIEGGVATIGAPSAFFKEGLENRYIGPLRELISTLAGFPVQIRVVIAAPQVALADGKLASREYGKEDDMDDYDDLHRSHNRM